eukprot:11026189-Prorocentrum_lima.AAC.1
MSRHPGRLPVVLLCHVRRPGPAGTKLYTAKKKEVLKLVPQTGLKTCSSTIVLNKLSTTWSTTVLHA